MVDSNNNYNGLYSPNSIGCLGGETMPADYEGHIVPCFQELEGVVGDLSKLLEGDEWLAEKVKRLFNDSRLQDFRSFANRKDFNGRERPFGLSFWRRLRVELREDYKKISLDNETEAENLKNVLAFIEGRLEEANELVDFVFVQYNGWVRVLQERIITMDKYRFLDSEDIRGIVFRRFYLCIESFRPSKRAKFTTYFLKALFRSLTGENDKKKIVRVTGRLKEQFLYLEQQVVDYVYSLIKKIRKRENKILVSDDSKQEIINATKGRFERSSKHESFETAIGLIVDMFNQIDTEGYMGKNLSIYTPSNDGKGDLFLGDVFGFHGDSLPVVGAYTLSSTDSPEGLVVSRDLLDKARKILYKLADGDKKKIAVIEHRLLCDGKGRTLEEIGKRFCVSREWIRQLENRLLDDLKKKMRIKGIR